MNDNFLYHMPRNANGSIYIATGSVFFTTKSSVKNERALHAAIIADVCLALENEVVRSANK